MFKRTESACRAELETADDYFSRILGVDPNHPLAAQVVRDLIEERCQDYLRNRWRDWPLGDLLILLSVLEPVQTPHSEAVKRGPGRPRKV
jgi:hypothetical protein